MDTLVRFSIVFTKGDFCDFSLPFGIKVPLENRAAFPFRLDLCLCGQGKQKHSADLPTLMLYLFPLN